MANRIITFIDEYITRNERGRPFELVDHQRQVLEVLFAFGPDGKLPWDTILYSCPKKSGKSTVNALISLAWAFTQEAPNEIYLLANNEDQARGRVYNTMTRIIRHNATGPDSLLDAVRGRERGLTQGRFELTNGTVVEAIAAEGTTAAGSNHGLVSYDELWAYRHDRARLLWAELVPVPTRKNSIRFVTTYAGFHGDGLLWDLYLKVVAARSTSRARGSGSTPRCPFTPIRRPGSWRTGTTRRGWSGSRCLATTPASARASARSTICASTRTAGRRRRRSSSPSRCGEHASIRTGNRSCARVISAS